MNFILVKDINDVEHFINFSNISQISKVPSISGNRNSFVWKIFDLDLTVYISEKQFLILKQQLKNVPF